MTTIGDIEVSKEDFQNFNWENVPSLSAERRCSVYWPHYFELANLADTGGDQKTAGINRLLGAATSLMLRPDNKQPFGILAVFYTCRSAALDDFSDQQIKVFGEVLLEIADSELRSRIADIVWTRKRDYLAAKTAIESYLNSAERLENPTHWIHSEKRIRRALKLAASLGRDNKPFDSVIEHIEKLLEKYKGEDPLNFTPKLMDLLLEYHKGDPVKYASYCKHAAEFSENLHDWKRVRRFWDLQASWYDLLGQTDQHHQAKLNAAEALVKEAEHSLTTQPPNYDSAAFSLLAATEALQKLGEKDRRDQVYGKLLEAQRMAKQNSGQISQTFDLTQQATAAIESVKGKGFQEAIIALALVSEVPAMKELRTLVETLAKESPIMAIMPIIKKDAQGRTIGHRASMLSENSSEAEEAIRNEMFHQAIIFQTMTAAGVIEPARQQIHLEHYFGVGDFEFLVQNNSFIPSSHAAVFAQGFMEGLRGDFISAVHLLMPQLENSLRHILSQNGAITSMLTDQQIQHDYTLGKLLYMDELKQILGEDTVFDLQGLLVEEFGSNLRNRLSHGMLSFQGMNSYTFVYFWWQMLRLSVLFLLARNSREESRA